MRISKWMWVAALAAWAITMQGYAQGNPKHHVYKDRGDWNQQDDESVEGVSQIALVGGPPSKGAQPRSGTDNEYRSKGVDSAPAPGNKGRALR